MKEILIEIMIFSLFVSRIRVSAFSIGQRGFRLHRTTAVSRQDTPVGPVNARCRRQSKFPYAWLTTGLVVASSGATFVFCQDDDTVRIPPFDESILSYDHYNGVSLLLDKFEGDDSSFPQNLEEAINFWKAEGRKGIWVHCPTYKSHLIPVSNDWFGFWFANQ